MYGSCNAKTHTQILYFSLQTDGKTQNNWITMRPCSRSASTWISLHPVWRMHHAMSRLYITCARIASDTSVWCIIEMDFMQNWPPDRQTDPRVCSVHGLEHTSKHCALEHRSDYSIHLYVQNVVCSTETEFCLCVLTSTECGCLPRTRFSGEEGHFKRFLGIIIFQFVIFKSGAGGCGIHFNVLRSSFQLHSAFTRNWNAFMSDLCFSMLVRTANKSLAWKIVSTKCPLICLHGWQRIHK